MAMAALMSERRVERLRAPVTGLRLHSRRFLRETPRSCRRSASTKIGFVVTIVVMVAFVALAVAFFFGAGSAFGG